MSIGANRVVALVNDLRVFLDDLVQLLVHQPSSRGQTRYARNCSPGATHSPDCLAILLGAVLFDLLA